MSKNTELYKKASEAIPGEDDRNFVLRQIRNGWCMGYEQAEKDLILRTKRWIAEIHRICDITDEHGYSIELRDLVASFEKTIKDEY